MNAKIDIPPNHIDAFIDALWLEDGLSKNTLEAYRRDLTQFAQFLAPSNLSLDNALELNINAYFSEKHSSTKATSANRRLTVFKRYYRWLLRERKINADPTLKIQAAKQALRVPKTMTETQVEALIAAPNTDTPLGLRDRTMLELMYPSG
ncbi:MAG TPA: site-specific integrase, partial [Burkholderiaceae bacterium]|nr:site-specific integrase [Burkholderiaceae bacterium]